MVRFENIDGYCIVISIKEHKKVKNKILKLIKKVPETTVYEKGQCIRNTDYIYGREVRREYLEFFWEVLRPYMKEAMHKMHCGAWNIDNGWFQQYTGMDQHDWHLHASTQFAGVYYLELPDPKYVTEFYDYKTNKKTKLVPCKEGDVILFPANMPHRSNTTFLKKRRTVIAFNCSFDRLNEEPINEELKNS